MHLDKGASNCETTTFPPQRPLPRERAQQAHPANRRRAFERSNLPCDDQLAAELQRMREQRAAAKGEEDLTAPFTRHDQVCVACEVALRSGAPGTGPRPDPPLATEPLCLQAAGQLAAALPW